MSFWEKGYLATAGAVALAASFYAYIIWQRSIQLGELVSPDMVSFVTYVVVVVVLSGIAFIVIASRLAIKAEPGDPAYDKYDERDKLVGQMSSGQASHVTSFGVYMALLGFIVHGDGNVLFYSSLAALAAGEVSLCLLRVFHYNRAI